VTLVLELTAFHLAGLHRQRSGDPLQRLDAGHLIDADGVRVVPLVQLKGVVVAGTHHLHLSLERLGIFLSRVQPIPALVRL